MSAFKSLFGKALGFDVQSGALRATDGLVTGGNGRPSIFQPSADIVALYDDFLGDILADEWNVVEGDTGASQAIAPLTNGVLRLTGSNTSAAAPASAFGVTSELNWKANQGVGANAGRLRMGARLKVDVLNRTTQRVSLFVGFTDLKTVEMPIYDTGAGTISPAADAVGIMFGGRADTGWSGVATKSTAGDSGDATPVALGVTPVNNVYTDLEVEISRSAGDTGGTATFYVNGQPKGRITSPVATGVALTPCVYIMQEDTGARIVDIDWIAVSAPRDSGT